MRTEIATLGEFGLIKHLTEDIKLQNEISKLCKEIYTNFDSKDSVKTQIDKLVYSYYELSDLEITTIEESIKDF